MALGTAAIMAMAGTAAIITGKIHQPHTSTALTFIGREIGPFF
jgi:hypothetical protein